MHMDKRTQILVIGHNESGCTANHEKIAYDTGAKIAQSGAILVTGGLGGVMQFSCMQRMKIFKLWCFVKKGARLRTKNSQE